jgi:drug/metabolite transporter (DMT)-like permease
MLIVAIPSFGSANASRLYAYALLVGAAVAWAISIVYVRSHRFTATTLALAPWQMLIAAALLLPVAILFEGTPPQIGTNGAASLVYVGPIATACAYWMVVDVGRHFRANTISMSLLAVPSVGILISALTLGERIDLPLIAGVLLIGVGIRLGSAARESKLQAASSEMTR